MSCFHPGTTQQAELPSVNSHTASFYLMMCLCHALLLWKEKKIGLNVFTAARTLSPSSDSPEAPRSSLQQSDSQQNPYQNHLLILGERALTTQQLLVTQEGAQHDQKAPLTSRRDTTAPHPPVKDCIVIQDFGTANLKNDTPSGKVHCTTKAGSRQISAVAPGDGPSGFF